MSTITRKGFLGAGLAAAGGFAGLTQPASAQELSAREQANLDLVTEFCAAFATRDMDKIRSYLADDFVYRLAEFAPWRSGEDGLNAMRSYVDSSETIQFEILGSWARGPIVVNERIDRFTGERTRDIHLTGVFFVVDGKIREWADYSYTPRV